MPNQTSRSDASLTCSANQEMLPEYPLVKILTCVPSYDEAVWAPFWRTIPNWTLNHVSCAARTAALQTAVYQSVWQAVMERQHTYIPSLIVSLASGSARVEAS